MYETKAYYQVKAEIIKGLVERLEGVIDRLNEDRNDAVASETYTKTTKDLLAGCRANNYVGRAHLYVQHFAEKDSGNASADECDLAIARALQSDVEAMDRELAVLQSNLREVNSDTRVLEMERLRRLLASEKTNGEKLVDTNAQSVKQLATAKEAYHHKDADCAKLRGQVQTLTAKDRGELWYWEIDGENNIGSITCPIVVEPRWLEKILLGAYNTRT